MRFNLAFAGRHVPWTDGASGRYQCVGFEQGVLRVRQEGPRKLVNRSLPVRPEQAGGAAAAAVRDPQALGTSREWRALLVEVSAPR